MTNNYVEFYVSVDGEATGKNPGDYSLSSFGAFIAGARRADGTFERFDRHDKANLFYAELKPINDNFVPEAIKVGLLEGFDLDDPTGELRLQWMKDHGRDPQEVMESFAAWVLAAKKRLNARPLFVAYPASFDWMFIYWYFCHFDVESPSALAASVTLRRCTLPRRTSRSLRRRSATCRSTCSRATRLTRTTLSTTLSARGTSA